MTRLLALCSLLSASLGAQGVILEAERPARQTGSIGQDRKAAASGGEVLGMEWGARAGHFAEYELELEKALSPASIVVRYARKMAGTGSWKVEVDGKEVGTIGYESTGGWGSTKAEFKTSALEIPELAAGKHKLRLTVRGPSPVELLPRIESEPPAVLARVGGRRDKNSVGHGKNIALYTGRPSRFFFSTHELGNIFSAADGTTVLWYPDHVVVSPEGTGSDRPNVNVDQIIVRRSKGVAPPPAGTEKRVVRASSSVREQRRVCVTDEDVVFVEYWLDNPTQEEVTHRVVIEGDGRGSRGWRGKPGGKKSSRRIANGVLLHDHNVFPSLFGGLAMAVGADRAPKEVDVDTPGAYRLVYEVRVPPRNRERLVAACAFDPDASKAGKALFRALAGGDVIAGNQKKWASFYADDVPRFECSDAGFEELYAFRWFLLKFSTTGGDLGYLKYPVVLEGRQAYQTYCCYSAPYMAFDLNWSVKRKVGFGHIASMALAAYDDGRFPWYTAPDTNEVPLHHRSRTGLSLLPHAAWKHYLVHGRQRDLIKLYSAMKRNVEWWIRDRDANGDGLFVLDHQLETGMDDLFRWPDAKLRYDAVDATSYAYANLSAVASMARVLKNDRDRERFEGYAKLAAHALSTLLWNDTEKRFHDRHPETKELSPLLTITTFYPFFAGAADQRHFEVFAKHLLNPEEFWLPRPIPALAKNQPGFGPRKFWQGPSWPAATSHVIEAYARAAKEHDPASLPHVAELLRRAVGNHLRPRADFFERYDPITGDPLSGFRDYMHSWWIDIFLGHVVGMQPGEGDEFEVFPLPMGFDHFAGLGIPFHGHSVDVTWARAGSARAAELGVGLTVRVDGKVRVRREDFVPGRDRVRVSVARE